jgi:hypothetical protein
MTRREGEEIQGEDYLKSRTFIKESIFGLQTTVISVERFDLKGSD